MKTKLYVLGLVTMLVVFLGIFFKVQHWPGAGSMLMTGTFMLVFLFLPLALRNNYRSEGSRENRILYIITWLTCFVVFVSMLFKIQHWPGAAYAMIVSLPFPYIVFLPVYLMVTGKNKNHDIYNTIAVLLLLTLVSAFSALLSLGVSKERIADNPGLAREHNRLENVLTQVQDDSRQSDVSRNIDDMLFLID